MSNDIILHFRDAPWSNVASALDYLAPRHPEKSTLPYRPPDGWMYPEGLNFIILMQYSDLLIETEPEERTQIYTLLGAPPACSLGVNFRRQTHYDIYSILEFLCLKLLRRFPGIVDDLSGEYGALWTVEEIEQGVTKAGGRFLDFYR